MLHPCTPAKFTILVANLDGASDPSLNSGGNPVKIRTGFVLQQVALPGGITRMGGPVQTAPATDASHCTAAIKVLSSNYWDPAVTAPGPFYMKEEIQVFDRWPVASEDFGAGSGGGTGLPATVATSLANALNTIPQIAATAIADTVYITSTRTESTLPLKATNDMSTILGGLVFRVLGSNAEILSGTGHQRRTFYINKPLRTQGPPVIL